MWEAYEKNPHCISKIKHPPLEMQKDYLSNHGGVGNINNLDFNIAKEILDKNPNDFLWFNEPSEKVCKYAINLKYSLIFHVNKPSEELQEMAVNQSPKALDNILWPSDKIKNYHILKWGVQEER